MIRYLSSSNISCYIYTIKQSYEQTGFHGQLYSLVQWVWYWKSILRIYLSHRFILKKVKVSKQTYQQMGRHERVYCGITTIPGGENLYWKYISEIAYLLGPKWPPCVGKSTRSLQELEGGLCGEPNFYNYILLPLEDTKKHI